MKPKVRLGLVGTGGMANSHAEQLGKIAGVELTSCLDVVPGRAEAFAKSARRRLVQHPRYFFFDTGVLNGVMGNFEPSADSSGALMEHLVFNQIVPLRDSWAKIAQKDGAG